jgi:hypothetical protein
MTTDTNGRKNEDDIFQPEKLIALIEQNGRPQLAQLKLPDKFDELRRHRPFF